ncbi:hypothetical protein [Bathymodiolus japonicus methanotrophic gill symbiont]|uniref:hypothetical protein n=1 Tax=Bathymodiolus japonicus methanotrophic gill symbiont TaxID=113269 RepID=UPI001C8CF7C9|nr:hypothetical protein [Bathymodiolus japonicus methanotrophic gill symbiont]
MALIEVFFEDWKLYEGWAALRPKQLDERDQSRGLGSESLFDHCLLLHPMGPKIARIESKLPEYPCRKLYSASLK